MKNFLMILLALLAITDVFAQFPSTGNHFFFYRYEFSEKDGVKAPRPRSFCDYLIIFVHNGEFSKCGLDQFNIDSEGTSIINERKDLAQFSFQRKSGRYFYDNSLSDSENSVYTPYNNNYSDSYVVSKDFDKLIEWNRFDKNGDFANHHYIRIFESDLTKPKAKPRFFDE